MGYGSSDVGTPLSEVEGRGSKVQDHPGLHVDLESRFGYMGHCVKEIKSDKEKSI